MSDNIDLSTNIAGVQFDNPVIMASGTYGFGKEYSEYVDLNQIGGISVKGLTLKERKGNKPPRIAETPAGILNSVGLQNPGVEVFIKEDLPFLKKYKTKIIANIAGNTIEEYCEMAEILGDSQVDAIEMNVSCPNVKAGCLAFGTSPKGIEEITSAVKKYCKQPLIVKLTPNVSDIKSIAMAAEGAGADCISLINTILGLAIDINKKKPILANNFGGLSGPAVKPIALRMVYEAAHSVKIPVIGMGGISSWEDAVEFILVGASAVMVGTANFVNPTIPIEIVNGIEKYLEHHGHTGLDEIIGKMDLND
ncbi:dihydroorotate dehydrogenase family protein [Ruminiclostridium papyrosolvens DSM 2782]|uniref:Dihydroorotate dehydrogenase n=1 Tax=Ruminiclostridium papyrosolvens DSM 2782 TaxID=588581 RepID=F1TEN8_9FIRM|nr:dihydroorotate dehydrogenase [Ruminiclostridium papyrosolvens]EGD47204.1 dihydroorotate dehydrogenase family protein [Ruminiclostridium papyrosolvens DSM 2782]WES36243.1 dihydroorotate dehydrogenase [Ruminiclostridium papyrosolvens DSM 2782]